MAQEAESTGLIGKLFSVEAVMMISFAVFIDAGEFFLELIPFAGQILSVILDIIALIFIGLWIYIRSGRTAATEATKLRVEEVKVKMGKTIKTGKGLGKKAGKIGKWLKPFCMGFEMIPILSSIAPLWIVAVLLELASD